MTIEPTQASASQGTEFDEAVRDLRLPLYHLALRIVRDVHHAQDLVQEGLSTIHRKGTSWRGEGTFRAWAFRIVRNLSLNHLRRHRPHVSLEALREEKGVERVDGCLRPEEVAQDAERQRLLWEALTRLPDRSREVLMLREFDGLKYREIATVLEVPIGTVMSRLHDARERLRRELEGRL